VSENIASSIVKISAILSEVDQYENDVRYKNLKTGPTRQNQPGGGGGHFIRACFSRTLSQRYAHQSSDHPDRQRCTLDARMMPICILQVSNSCARAAIPNRHALCHFRSTARLPVWLHPVCACVRLAGLCRWAEYLVGIYVQIDKWDCCSNKHADITRT